MSKSLEEIAKNISIEMFALKFGFDRNKALFELQQYLTSTEQGEKWTLHRERLSDVNNPYYAITPGHVEKYMLFRAGRQEPATQTPPKTPPKELLKALVARAAWEVNKETGKMNYKHVLDKLRIMAKSEDQAGAIIKNVSTTKGVTIIGRDEPIAVGTIENWLRPLRAEAKKQQVTESRK